MAGERQRPRSWEVTEGPQRAPARAMLRAVGLLRGGLRQAAGRRRLAAGTRSRRATTTSTSSPRSRRRACARATPCRSSSRRSRCRDGIAMGHEGMKASLMIRDLIADSVELVMHAERMDALVGIAGCDKSEPGHADGDGAPGPAGVYLYGGTILPGTYQGRDITIQDVFEAVGAHAKGTIDDEELRAASSAPRARPRARAPGCTRRTRWRPSGEALGMSLPGAASPPAVDYRREVAARESGVQAATAGRSRGTCCRATS